MKDKLIIGFCGYAQSGKTTAARGFEVFSNTTKAMHIFPLAQPIKDIALSMGWDGLKDERGRKLLQLLGTECGRNLIGPDTWLKLLEESLSINPDFDVILIDDVRFVNEADWIMANKGFLIRVIRPGQEPDRSHESETALEGYLTLTVTNDGSMDDLGRAVADLISELPQWKEFHNANRH